MAAATISAEALGTRATALLMEGIANRHGATPAAVAGLGERAIIAMDRGEWDEASRLAGQALGALHAGRLDHYAMAAFVHAVVARALQHQGDAPRAREHLVQAIQQRPLLNSAMPHRSVQTLVQLARAYLGLDDVAGARAVLAQAHEILGERPSLGSLPRQVANLEAVLDGLGQGTPGASSLTAAELRLLPLLSTHLTLLEIGERLYLSRNTVKTQAVSIYRKLGVSSRSEAMRRATALGLLGG